MEHYQTEVPTYLRGGGDLIYFPVSPPRPWSRGALPRAHAFHARSEVGPRAIPIRHLHNPEISTVGRTEEELTQRRSAVRNREGRRYREIARGQIIGDSTGLLKLVFHTDTRELLGVHIIGEGSSELVHIGQAVLAFGGKIRLLRKHGLQLPQPWPNATRPLLSMESTALAAPSTSTPKQPLQQAPKIDPRSSA